MALTKKLLRIATRKSPLALKQANTVLQLLKQHWPNQPFELLPLVTSGDRLAVAGKGLFVKELEEALLDGRADLAVHSTKDMPAICPDGLFLAAICQRDNPLDVFISKQYASIQALPEQAIIGTASLRRQSQLLAYRSDLCIKPLRGNIQTRLSKLETGAYDAIILAAAGLERMGLTEHITELLADEFMLPACGQGALAIECRTDDLQLQSMLVPLNDPLSALCVRTERQVNTSLGGNCHVPLAVFCKPLSAHEILLRAKIGTSDGSFFIEDSQRGLLTEAWQLAENCTTALLAKGAAELLQAFTA